MDNIQGSEYWLKWMYLGRLWCSLQNECTDALLVAVLVHDYERIRKARCCKKKKVKHYNPSISNCNIILVVIRDKYQDPTLNQ